MVFWILLIAALCFVIYSVVVYWGTTPADKTVWQRIGLAVAAAAMALIGAFQNWLIGPHAAP